MVAVFLRYLDCDDGEEHTLDIDHSTIPVDAFGLDSMSQQGSNAAGPDGCRLFALMQYTCVAQPEIKCWPFERVFRQ